jgi:hypothetical protein
MAIGMTLGTFLSRALNWRFSGNRIVAVVIVASVLAAHANRVGFEEAKRTLGSVKVKTKNDGVQELLRIYVGSNGVYGVRPGDLKLDATKHVLPSDIVFIPMQEVVSLQHVPYRPR